MFPERLLIAPPADFFQAPTGRRCGRKIERTSDARCNACGHEAHRSCAWRGRPAARNRRRAARQDQRARTGMKKAMRHDAEFNRGRNNLFCVIEHYSIYEASGSLGQATKKRRSFPTASCNLASIRRSDASLSSGPRSGRHPSRSDSSSRPSRRSRSG